MFMLKNYKKGITLVELIVALAIFIILLIPISNIIITNSKNIKEANEKSEMSLAVNYGYETLRKILYSIKVDGETYYIDNKLNSIDVSDNLSDYLIYKGKINSYCFEYTAYYKDEESYVTPPSTTYGGEDEEFNSKIININLKIYKLKGNNKVDINLEEAYTFRLKG